MKIEIVVAFVLAAAACNSHEPIAASARAPLSSPVAPVVRAPSRRGAAWMSRQRGYPGGIPAGADERAALKWRERFAPRTNAAALSWTPIGPAPINMAGSQTPNWGMVSGRVQSIAIDPTNAQTIYLGMSQGGVWKSTDGGTSWSVLTDGLPPAIGTLVIDPGNHLTIWAGTGEGDGSSDSLGGAGVLKSTDGGATWTQYSAAQFAGASFTEMKIDAGGNLYATVNTGNDGNDACNVTTGTGNTGLYRSVDGGQTWTQLQAGKYSSFTIDGTAPTHGFLLASPYTGVTRWTEGSGLAPAAVTITLPANTRVNGLRLARASASIVYLGIGLFDNGTNSSSGALYVSTNANTATPSFASVTTPPNFCETQCDYDNLVAVDPADDNTVYLGGSLCAVWKGSAVRTGTPTWSSVTVSGVTDATSCDANWFNGVFHADVHALVVAPGGKVYVGSDGGFGMSSNGGGAWTTPDVGLATGMFHGLCIDPTTHLVYGGLQDNGSDAQPMNGLTWRGIGSGDGGRCVARPSASGGAIMIEVQEATVSVSSDGFATLNNPIFATDQASCAGFGTCGDFTAFVAPMAGDTLQPLVAYVGTNRLWRTPDFGASGFTAVSADLTAGAGGNGVCASPDYLTAIAVAPTKSDSIYTGSSEGVLHRVTQAGVGTALTGAALPLRWVTDIVVDPTDDKIVYVAYSGFSANTVTTPGHIFKSTDGGGTWARADAGLPDSPINAMTGHARQSGRLWVGTDFGVIETVDGGATWSAIGAGLPRQPVTALAFDGAVNMLVAGTYGRSAWKIVIPPPAVTGVMPATGVPAGGTNVMVIGSGFAAGAIVTFGGAAATVTATTPTALAVTTPPHAAGAVDVVVTNPDGQTVTAAGAFTYAVPVPPDMATPLDMTIPPDLARAPAAPDMTVKKGGTGKGTGGCSCDVGGGAGALPLGPGLLLALALLAAVTRRRRS